MASNSDLFDYENTKAWYAVKTQNRREEDVRESLLKKMETTDLGDKLFNVVIPYETVETYKNDKLIETKKKLYPGYVFVEMYMTDQAWFILRNTKNVHGFVGSHGHGSKPTPMVQKDMLNILNRINEIPKTDIPVELGQLVVITYGPFCGYKGKVKTIKGNTAIVPISFMGRDTDAEIEIDKLTGVNE